jgi:hypothetical protein
MKPERAKQPEPTPSPRERAKEWLRQIGAGDHNRKRIIGLARELLIPNEKQDTIRYVVVTEGVIRLLGETGRFRRGQALRPFEEVRRDGEQLRLSFVELRFGEARQVVARKRDAGRVMLIRAEFEESIYKLALERCKERGQDPDDIELTIGTFVDGDEVEELWREATRRPGAPRIRRADDLAAEG